MKISVNSPCPCGSKKKYKQCCQRYHKGAQVKDALTLIKSRYSAYVVGDGRYIIKTTHQDNPEYHDDKQIWQKSIKYFSQETQFKSLKILKVQESENEVFVTFKAQFAEGNLHEKSRFVKENGFWLYREGEIKKT